MDFGDVPANRFEPDGRQQVAPGNVAFFAHAFVAGSGGQVVFAAAASAPPGWTVTLYPDADCDGRLDGNEQPLAGAALAAVAGQRLCIVVKVAVPLEADANAQASVALTARWTYQRSGATSDHARGDVVTVVVAPTPAWTCQVTNAPAVGGSGRVEWSFGGALPGRASGSVTLSVVVQ